MKNLTLPVIKKNFIAHVGKTAIECDYNNQKLVVWANGDVSLDQSILCNVTVNEVGDTFVATKDSRTIDETTNKPIYLAGETVTRNKQSTEFNSFAGNNANAQIVQAASAYKVPLQVVLK